MSEQWWAVKYIGSKYSFQTVFGEISTNKKECQEIIESLPEKEHVNFVIVPVRIVEDAEPCAWELSQFGDSQPYKNEKDWISFISQYGWRWCPMCGRSLKEE